MNLFLFTLILILLTSTFSTNLEHLNDKDYNTKPILKPSNEFLEIQHSEFMKHHLPKLNSNINSNNIFHESIQNNKRSYYQKNDQSSLEIGDNKYKSVTFEVIGTPAALNAMKLESQFTVSINESIVYGTGLKSDITDKYFTHICTSLVFTLAASENGDIIFFGNFGYFNGEIRYRSKPRIIWNVDKNHLGKIEQLECGFYHAIIRTDKNKIYGFGTGIFGQFGNEYIPQAPIFTYLQDNIIDVKIAYLSTLFLDTNGHVWISGKFDILNKDDLKFKKIQLYFEENALEAIYISLSVAGAIVVGKDRCMYSFGIFSELNFDKNTSKGFVNKVENITCNIETAFVSTFSNWFGYKYLNQNYLIYQFNSENLFIQIHSLKKEYQNITKITSSKHIAFHLSNKEVIGFDIEPIYDILNRELNHLYIPESLSLTNNMLNKYKKVNSLEYIRAIDCSLFHCAVLGQGNGLYTAGLNDLRTCNDEYSNLTNCLGYNSKEFEATVEYVIPYIDQYLDCKIGMLQYDEYNYYSTKVFNIYDCNNFNLIDSIDAKNIYPPKLDIYTNPVLSNQDGKIIGTKIITPFFISEISLDLSLLNLTNKNGTSPETNYIQKLDSFKDFQHVELILTLNNSYIGFFHIANGKYSGGLAIVELDLKYNFLKEIYFFEDIDYFSFKILTNYLTPIKEKQDIHLYGISNKYNQSIIHRFNSILRDIETFYPINSSIIIKRIAIYKSIMGLSTEGKLYKILLENNTYKLIETDKTDKFIHIVSDLYKITYLNVNHEAIYENENDIIIVKNVSKIQPFLVISSTGIQLYKGIECNGVVADDFRVCNGHGTCVLNNYCICIDNYFGDNCTEKFDFTCNGWNPIFKDKVCNGKGTCIGQDNCICILGFDGNDCSCNGTISENGICIPHCIVGIYYSGLCLETYIVEFVILAVIISIIAFTCILCILTFIILILGSTLSMVIIRKKNNLIQKNESLLYDLIRDQELEDMDEDKHAWELNKKHFQIEPNELEIIKKVGSGGEGIVFLAKWKQLKVAVKYYNCKLISEDNIIQNFKKETVLLSSLRHPNIITFYGATLSYPRVGFILEFAPQSVDKFIENGESEKSSKDKLLNMLLEVSNAMSYLHSKNIIHRDLKWQNVLLNQFGVCKITDFGLSKINDSTSNNFTKNVGTGFYIAPENYKGLEYDYKVDVYAFGLMIVELLCGRLNPWSLDESTKDMTIMRISSEASHNPSFRPNPKHLETRGYSQLISLCSKCWSHNSSERPTFDEIQETLINFKNSLELNTK